MGIGFGKEEEELSCIPKIKNQNNWNEFYKLALGEWIYISG
jgi:hypothetical protein